MLVKKINQNSLASFSLEEMFVNPTGVVGLPDHDCSMVMLSLCQGQGPRDPGLVGRIILQDGAHSTVCAHILPSAHQQKGVLKLT